ncbi:ribose-5-phosphate isomerase [Microbacterium sp. C23T]
MRIHIATDHSGLRLSTRLREDLQRRGHEVRDHGPRVYDPLDDYPAFCFKAASAVARDWADGRYALGILLGGSGNGQQIAANKVKGVRAALVWNLDTATLAREQNNANVIAMGARQHSFEDILAFVDVFIETPFSGDECHERRIRQIATYETGPRRGPLNLEELV